MKRVLAIILYMVLAVGCTQSGAGNADGQTSQPAGEISLPDGDTAGASAPDASTRPAGGYEPLENYQLLPIRGGREHVLYELRDDDYRPIEDYPFLLPFCEDELAELDNWTDSTRVTVAEYDVNGDGQPDYFIQISSMAYGQMGPQFRLVIHRPDGSLAEIPLRWIYLGVAIMDTQSNGFADLGSSGYDYNRLLKYSEDAGYEAETPPPLYLRRLLPVTRSYKQGFRGNDLYIEDGRLCLDAMWVAVWGSAPPRDKLPFYVGLQYDQFNGLVKDNILWAHDKSGALLRFYGWFDDFPCTFMAEITDEDAVAAIIQAHDQEAQHIGSTGMVFAYIPGEAPGTQTDARYLEYLMEMVPEVEGYRSYLHSKTDGAAHLEIAAFPIDPGSAEEIRRTHYTFLLLESHPDYSDAWGWFYVKEDLSEVLFRHPNYSPPGRYDSLAKWRNSGYYRYYE